MLVETMKQLGIGGLIAGVSGFLIWLGKSIWTQSAHATEMHHRYLEQQIAESKAQTQLLIQSYESIGNSIKENTAVLTQVFQTINEMAIWGQKQNENIATLVEYHRKDIDDLIADHTKSKR